MTIQGIIQNGVVVLQGGTQLPDGTPVTVLVDSEAPVRPAVQGERLSESEYQRLRAIFDEIAALPNENPGDTFSGRDHDKVLYGEP